jgi:hypothetical protein
VADRFRCIALPARPPANHPHDRTEVAAHGSATQSIRAANSEPTRSTYRTLNATDDVRSATSRWSRSQTALAAEIVAIVLIAGFLVCILTTYKLVRIDQLYGDSAMYLQATENIVRHGLPESQVQSRIVHYLDESGFLSEPVDQIAANPQALFGGVIPTSQRNLLLGHAYFILYPIAQITRLVPVRTVLLTCYVLAYIGMLLAVYVACRRRHVSILGTALFCLLVASHPAWWQGLLSGQFYPDRLFVCFGLIFMLAVARLDVTARDHTYLLWLLVLGIACASINERGALVAGIFLFAYTILFWRATDPHRWYRLGLGTALALYGYGVVKLVLAHTNAEYAGDFLPTSFGDLVYRFEQPGYMAKIGLFAVVNAPLLCLAARQWRTALIAVLLMIPNIIGNIGGAEKTGWSTHYPSFFFPSLVFAGLIGYASLLDGGRRRVLVPAYYVLIGALSIFVWMVNPDSVEPISIQPANIARSFLPSYADNLNLYVFSGANRDLLQQAERTLESSVPPNTTVSSIELGMAHLYRDRILDFFPSGIDHADYAVLGAAMVDGKLQYNGAISYRGASEQRKLNDLVTARMRLDGYDLQHPILAPALAGIAVVRRIR